MRRIRGLLVEDLPVNVDTVCVSLDLAFHDLCEWKIDWTVCGSAPEARMTIKDSDYFDFAIVDIGLGEGNPTGTPVAEYLTRSEERTFVLLISSVPDKYAKTFTNRTTTLPAIFRSQLNDGDGEWSYDRLAAKIRRHVLTHEHAPTDHLKFDENDPGIVSILESLGGPPDGRQRGAKIAYNLAMRCLDPIDTRNPVFQLSYLAPGRSGAYVCRVGLFGDNQPEQAFVLKIGLDARALQQELAANRQAAKALREQSLVQITGEVQSDPSGYSAIIARVAEQTRTMSAWLAGDATPEQARDIANMLFGEELSRLAVEEVKAERPLTDWLKSPAITTLRVEAELDRIGAILGHPAGAARTDATQIRDTILAFTQTGTLPVADPRRLNGSAVYVRGFGDLHSSNVLIQTGRHPRPILIDASGYGSHHWATDSARLMVDVFLRVRAPGLPAMLWEDFDDSVRTSISLCPRCTGGIPFEDMPVDHFLDEVVSGLPENLRFEPLGLGEQIWHWQWHVGLAKEFLRQGCHADLTLPRSVLAFVAASCHLRRATDLVTALRY